MMTTTKAAGVKKVIAKNFVKNQMTPTKIKVKKVAVKKPY